MADVSYETMWDIVFGLNNGHPQKWVARKFGVSKSYVNALAKEYDVGRRQGQTKEGVQKEAKWVEAQAAIGLVPEVKIRTSIAGMHFPLRIRKDLLGPAEKAQIVASMRANPSNGIKGFSQEFKRLPATIVKIAAEAGITLR